MNGTWVTLGNYNLYFSTARSMARFGLLNLNKGTWDETVVLSDNDFFDDMTSSSQNINPSYGYLWWLNGQSSYTLPGSTNSFNGPLFPDAPNDLIAGLGKNDQKLYIVPSENIVIVRMGDSAGQDQLGPSSYDNQLWQKINDVIY